MKKSIVALLLLTLCLGLCACGVGGQVEVTLPTVPEQIAAPSRSFAEETQGTESIGETYPWDVEFLEEEYSQFQGILEDENQVTIGKNYVWTNTSVFHPARDLRVYDNGTIEDTYYGYPGYDFPSHQYIYKADGSFLESHYLGDGYFDHAANMAYWGTTVYYKIINPDGSFIEMESDENGHPIHQIQAESDGYYDESFYFDNGTVRKNITDDPIAGTYMEHEYFENGMIKYSKEQTPEQIQEIHNDEKGYCTYFYWKASDWEVECIGDENGKLVKIIENGVEQEDSATLAQYAVAYNFRH